MSKVLLARKGVTTRRFTSDGQSIPVTELHCADCFLLGQKNIGSDGYSSLILGLDQKKRTLKSIAGQSKKAKLEAPVSIIREFRVEMDAQSKYHPLEVDMEFGQQLTPDNTFAVTDKVKVESISKGKGFAGVVKRHGFAGGPRTHGQTDRERAPGSIGQTTTPGRVYRGKRMAGRMGNDTVTIAGLEVIEVTPSSLFLRGTIPGSKGSLVKIYN